MCCNLYITNFIFSLKKTGNGVLESQISNIFPTLDARAFGARKTGKRSHFFLDPHLTEVVFPQVWKLAGVIFKQSSELVLVTINRFKQNTYYYAKYTYVNCVLVTHY